MELLNTVAKTLIGYSGLVIAHPDLFPSSYSPSLCMVIFSLFAYLRLLCRRSLNANESVKLFVNRLLATYTGAAVPEPTKLSLPASYLQSLLETTDSESQQIVLNF